MIDIKVAKLCHANLPAEVIATPEVDIYVHIGTKLIYRQTVPLNR